MSSGGGGGGSTTTTQELPSWAQPYAQQLLERGAALSNTTTPQYTGQTVADLNGTQTGAISGLTSAAGNQTGTSNAAMAYYNSLLGNPNGYSISNPYTGNVTASTAADSYANPSNNPYLAQTVAASNKQITDAYQNGTAASTLAQFRNAGAFGGTAQQQATTANENSLANTLSNNTAGMYNSAYNTAAGVASQNAAQQNAVGLANQSVGTSANQAYNTQASSNYNNQQANIANALNGSTAANTAASSLYGNQLTGGAVAQGNSQDQLNALYQQWYNQVNQPYANLSTLSGALSGALGSGAGVTTQTSSAGSGNSLGTLLGLGQTGLGFASMLKGTS
jgi:hypothetical protein